MFSYFYFRNFLNKRRQKKQLKVQQQGEIEEIVYSICEQNPIHYPLRKRQTLVYLKQDQPLFRIKVCRKTGQPFMPLFYNEISLESMKKRAKLLEKKAKYEDLNQESNNCQSMINKPKPNGQMIYCLQCETFMPGSQYSKVHYKLLQHIHDSSHIIKVRQKIEVKIWTKELCSKYENVKNEK